MRPVFTHSITVCSYYHFHIELFQLKDCGRDKDQDKDQGSDPEQDKNQDQDKEQDQDQDRN